MALDDSYTTSLVHFDGVDGATTFPDESGKTWTVYGNSHVDGTTKKIGTGSLYLDGSGDYITTPMVTDFQFGSGSFTIDMWIKRPATMTGTLFNTGGVVGSVYPDIDMVVSGNNINMTIWNSSTNTVSKSVTLTDTQSFHHLALIRDGNNWYFSLDGTIGTATSWAGTVDYDNTRPIILGYQLSGTTYWTGWIDEFRISKGVARWNSNFTPPPRGYGNASPNYLQNRGRDRLSRRNVSSGLVDFVP